MTTTDYIVITLLFLVVIIILSLIFYEPFRRVSEDSTTEGRLEGIVYIKGGIAVVLVLILTSAIIIIVRPSGTNESIGKDSTKVRIDSLQAATTMSKADSSTIDSLITEIDSLITKIDSLRAFAGTLVIENNSLKSDTVQLKRELSMLKEELDDTTRRLRQEKAELQKTKNLMERIKNNHLYTVVIETADTTNNCVQKLRRELRALCFNVKLDRRLVIKPKTNQTPVLLYYQRELQGLADWLVQHLRQDRNISTCVAQIRLELDTVSDEPRLKNRFRIRVN